MSNGASLSAKYGVDVLGGRRITPLTSRSNQSQPREHQLEHPEKIGLLTVQKHRLIIFQQFHPIIDERKCGKDIIADHLNTKEQGAARENQVRRC